MSSNWRAIIFVLLCCATFSVNAFEWQDLWLNKNQQAMRILEDNPSEAAEQFDDSQWRGVGNYKAGNFDSAVENFSHSETPDAKYNQGNSLARSGKLEDALSAYDEVLAKENLSESLRENTEFNRDLVKKIMEQQQKQSQQGENGEDSENSEQQDSQEKSENSPSSDSQGNSGEQSDTENQGEQSQDENTSDNNSDADSSENSSQDKSSENTQDEDVMNQGQSSQETPVSEDEQATEQWLRKIPEDPTGLLRRKLEQTHQTQFPQIRNGEQPW